MPKNVIGTSQTSSQSVYSEQVRRMLLVVEIVPSLVPFLLLGEEQPLCEPRVLSTKWVLDDN